MTSKRLGYRFCKRAFDIFSSFLAILILSPLFLVLIIANLIATHGQAFYADPRVGKKGKHIGVLKFRSMYIDAETNIEKYLTPEQLEQWKRERKVDDDPRITPFGRFLRKTSLDELPQLFNIFIGNMSIVGPRPLSQQEIDVHFSKEEAERLLSVPPGLLSNWAVHGRSEVNFASGERQKLELEYIEKRSLLFDLKLIFLAIPAVLRHKGAK